MTLKERIVTLCKQSDTPVSKLEKELGFAGGYISKLDKSTPNSAKLQKIAGYFGVTLDYLMTGNEPFQETILTPKDERDIAKTLDRLMSEMEKQEDSPLYYNGAEVDEESKELMKEALDNALRQLKMINKIKYNPNKNKK